MGNQASRAKYEAAILAGSLEASTFIEDPFDVLGIDKGCSWDDMVKAYRRLSMLVHPDRPGGSKVLFQTVTDAFRRAAHIWKASQADKPHHMLRAGFNEYIEQNESKYEDDWGKEHAAAASTKFGSGTSFNKDKFNQMFEKHRLDDDNDDGYGQLMEKSNGKTREDIEVPRMLSKFEKIKFNREFEQNVPVTKDVVKYSEPQALIQAKKLNFVEIGEKPDDYSSDTSRRRDGLQYTDYMRAHTTHRLVDPRELSRKTYKSVEEYDAEREKVTKMALTKEELMRRKLEEEERESMEQRRLQRVKERDMRIAEHHRKLQQMLLTR